MQKGDIGGSLLLKDDSGLIDNINELISIIKGPSINRIKGDLEELIVGSLNLSSLVENRAFEAIKDSLFDVTKKVGDDTSKIQIDMSQFAEGEYLQKMLSKNYHLADDLSLTLESNNASQDKIDIKLEFKDKTVGASVKNVNLQKRKRITLSASGSFLAMIQYYNQDQFINHYLNIMAYHPNFVQGYTEEGSAPYKEYQARLDDSELVSLRRNVRAEMGLTILFIAHDLSVVKYFSDRIAVMYFGKIVELASSDELFAHPLHPYTKSLLSAIPLPDPVYEKKRKRITYNPLADHDYSIEKPTMREVKKGHFVYCNSEEEKRYKKELSGK